MDNLARSTTARATWRRRGLGSLAVAGAAIALSAASAGAKGGSSVTVTTSAVASGSLVPGQVTIANDGAKAITVSAVRSALEVRFASGVTPPALPIGSTSGWYLVASASLPAPGVLDANTSRSLSFVLDTCGAGVGGFAGAKDMRSVATVTAGQAYSARSLSFALPARCPLCGNGVLEVGEQCDQGAAGGACCASTCRFRANGVQCSDGNGCTLSDQCQAGVCTGGAPIACTAADQCHTAGTCNPATGLCSNPAAPNAASCDDRNACTRSDTCQAGVCRGGDPVTCSAGDQCQDARCDAATGGCITQPRVDGSECMDGDACSVGDHCNAGACVSGAARDCDDRLSCTDDGCEPATGCANAAAECDGCDAGQCAACGGACDAAQGQCEERCWASFMSCLSGCTTTYCAPFCQVDLNRCITACPTADLCRATCDAGNACAPGCTEAP